MYSDAHTHLNSDTLFSNRERHLDDFCGVWGTLLINIGVDAIYNQRAITIAQASVGRTDCVVKAAIWYHPCIVAEQSLDISTYSAMLDTLREQITQHRQYIVALGEVGVDLHRHHDYDTTILQQTLFDKQCQLASELWLSLVIHSRDAFTETVDIIQHYPNLPVYFHCRGYGVAEVDYLLTHRKQLALWFCANTSYPKAQSIRDSLLYYIQQKSPDHALLLETDAPYLAIQSQRWDIQTPAQIPLLYAYIANLMHIQPQPLADQVLQDCKQRYWLA
jgi:TatD DNase family protein